ncbi:MAG: Creatinine amidohydrolase [candidate division WS2 bacterium]|uniref:Creatinine amidohydrolase n=1 Tax=Psychracetigena formicireducens TaxID=2986056 RepID=A0A9E2BIY5_PSYF1|nr:Creatinine amidohydrolase [Candidatus Psychracetigena formicireducens]
MSIKYCYWEMSWPEIKERVKDEPVCIIPVGVLEDHGPHLPLDTDVLIVNEICKQAVENNIADSILLPPVVHGYSPHHMDFPGTISIRWNVLVEYLLDINRSLIKHGFKRILLVNGHGSNSSLVNMVSRLTIVEHPEVLCADSFYLTTPESLKLIEELRESDYPGGIAHACELETSLYLAIKPELVDMSRAVKDISYPESQNFFFDWVDGSARMMEWWSTLSKTGIMGDPTKATVEKGKRWLKAAVGEISSLIKELKSREIRKRVDHHL